MDSKEVAAKKADLGKKKGQINNDLRNAYEVLGMIAYTSIEASGKDLNLDAITIKESEREGFIKQVSLAKQQHERIQKINNEILALDSVMVCPKCGKTKDYDGEFCIYCGTRFEAQQAATADAAGKHCIQCGTVLEDDAVFCHICGQKQPE